MTFISDHDSLDDAITMLANKHGWVFPLLRLALMSQFPKLKPSKLQSRFEALHNERFGKVR